MNLLHLARPDDIQTLLPLVERFHEHHGISQTDEKRHAALMPLLEGIPHGMIYLIGPRKAPVGYIIISLGYSVELGGIEGFVDEFFIREKIRGRGMGSEVLMTLLPALKENGIRALHLEVERDNEKAQRLYKRAGFEPRENYMLMTRTR
ncbi:GNAT family N-acetyltransferase [Lentibacter sp. XHP0401]|jgi:ribosomal protein S18 acetylase RimI-like enzyme|uniref:GNAT family N-acetyltransferase n=1 Tax=Lentibacter sp. XHP0401 TaxID=2984334 RepID=UPI0021E862CE|nr:GNAT family N-acetyltransferase [Lentibacter sp. XHP0401]MCV2891707.1 GNAT family N-acetyltransferase [Lentibacter sp. XHP0401]